MEHDHALCWAIGKKSDQDYKSLDNIGSLDDHDCYSLLKAAVDGHFKRKLNRVYLLNKLHQVQQQAGESIDNFLIRVKEKVVTGRLAQQEIIELITLSQMVNNCVNKHVKREAIRNGLDFAKFMAG